MHNVSVSLIDKTDGKNPLKREYFWLYTLNTLELHGLNVEEDFYILIYLFLYFIGTMYWPVTYYYCIAILIVFVTITVIIVVVMAVIIVCCYHYVE